MVRCSNLLKVKEIERAKEGSKETSDYNLKDLLPKLKEQHETSNRQLTERQGNIIKLLKGTKLNDEFNSPTTRRYFGKDLSKP